MRRHDGDVAALKENPAGGLPATGTPAMAVRCWGTRGSVPSPGPRTARYGGNTSCIEVRTEDDRLLILDAGSGLRELGEALIQRGQQVRAELFLTHFHWDHIQGFPFFTPLYDRRTRLRVHGARQHGLDLPALLAGQMAPIYFPIPLEAVAAELAFAHLTKSAWRSTHVEVAAFPLRHPGSTFGYRVRSGGVTMAYLPDNELAGDAFPVAANWRGRLVNFLRGADLLFHDAMFTDDEYRERAGWGHSTFDHAVALAEEAGVRRLHLFHHAPSRSDQELDDHVGRLRDDLQRRGSGLELFAACEGETIELVSAPAARG
jgi:phosphoribosyl 1,2-cyclic phosphodiesterase